MKLWYCLLIFTISFTELMLAQDDGDFDDIDNEDFDDLPQTHYHDHDDDGSFEVRKSLERVSFIVLFLLLQKSSFLIVFVFVHFVDCIGILSHWH